MSRPARRPAGLLASALLAGLAAAPGARAQTVFGLSGTDLTSVELSNPAQRTRKSISGITPGQTLVGMDFRPATGELYALGYNAATQESQLYTLDINSLANSLVTPATAVGSAVTLALGGATERIGFDFNPTVDRIRVVSTNDANYRLVPTTGAIVDGDPGTAGTQPDGNLAYNAGSGGPGGGGPGSGGADPNAGQNPFVGTAGYTNSFIGATSTTLFVIDEQRALLLTQNPPNNGVLNTVAALNTTPAINSVGTSTDLDIFTDPTTRVQKAYLSVNSPDTDPSRAGQFVTAIYSVSLTSSSLTLETTIGGGNAFDPPTNANQGPGITDIAVRITRAAPTATGQLLYAVTTTNNLISFFSDDPGNLLAAVPITGIATGQTLVGTDFRPNTGQLMGLGYNPATGESRLYVLDRATAVATAVGAAPITLDLGTTTAALNGVGFDFNPTVDRIRVTGLNTRNYRLNPNNGALAFTDGDLNFVAGASGTPTIGAVAYTNSYAGSTSTTLYDIDGVRNQLFIQNNPNAGQLSAVNSNPLFAGAVSSAIDVDIFFDGPAQVNRAFAVSDGGASAADAFSTLYTMNLAAAQTTASGVIGLGVLVRDVAAFLNGADASATLTGRLLYGVAAGNLVSFDSGNPGVIRTAVNITGLPANGSQVLVGADFRPADGQLYALGYAAATQEGQLYTLNLTTGALTGVGSLQSMLLGATAANIGFDFNPVPDRIRITSATNQANLRMNPTDATFITDGTLTNPSGTPALSAVAYTNNDNNGNTGTTLYGYDQARNVLLRSTNANAGTYVDQGAGTGLTVNPGVDFDIFADLTLPATPANTAFLVAAPAGTTSDNLYTLDLTAGTASAGARIGNGSNLTALAAFLTPGPVVVAGLTWTGAVGTDWGTAGNWSPAQVPTATDNVTIPDVANDPVVSNAQQANGVTLGAGATLTTANGGVLTVNGNFVNNGGSTLGAGTGEARFAGAAAQTISGSMTMFHNLTAGPAGVMAAGAVQVQRLLTLNGTLASNGNLTLLSNASGTAQVVNNGAAGVTGNATVQRFIDPSQNGGSGYRHYSAPVTGSTIADLTTGGFTPTLNPAYNTAPNPGAVAPFPTVFGYDEARVTTSGNPAPRDFDKGFFSPGSAAEALVVTRGYAVNLPATQTVDFVGTLNNGAVAASGLTRGTETESGWQLLGNPYPSPIDWDLVDRVNVDAAVYVYRSTGPYVGTYSSYVANGAGTNGGTDVIGAGQGFFTRVSSFGTGQVSFANTMRLTSYASPVFQRPSAITGPLVRLDLRAGTGAADETVVYFEPGATAGFDAAMDAYKLLAGGTPVLASELNPTTHLSVNALPPLTTTDRVITLYVAAQQAGPHTLRAVDLLRLPVGTYAYLRDAQTGALIDLAQQSSYAFTAIAGPQVARFSLLLTQNRPLATAPAALAQQVSLYPNPAQQSVALRLPATLRQQAVEVTLVNALGQTVRRYPLAAARATDEQLVPLTGVSKGVYTLRVTTSEGIVNKRLVVE